jgi:5-hydroxyisourate hydrolase
MSAITTHVLDVARGRPAAGVPVVLELIEKSGAARELGQGATDADGRLRDLLRETLRPGTYRLRFDTAAYFQGQNAAGFYPEVSISFEVRDAAEHYHVPLLLSPFGYSTYRGS